MSSLACKNCVHFLEDPGEAGYDTDGDGLGQCRRYPPTVSMFPDKSSMTMWVEVFPDEWCGEFEDVDPPDSAEAVT